VYANGDVSGDGCKDADSEDSEDEDEQIDIAECLASLVRGNIIGKVLLERALLQVMESFTLSQAVLHDDVYSFWGVLDVEDDGLLVWNVVVGRMMMTATNGRLRRILSCRCLR